MRTDGGSLIPLAMLQTAFVSLSFISTFVLSPICLIYCRRMYRLRGFAYFQKRMVRLSIACPLITMVQMVLYITSELPHIFPSLFVRIAPQYLMHWRMYGGHMIFAAEMIRIWFLFFQHSKNIQTITQKWATTDTVKGKLWALGHKKWFTDRSKALYVLACAWILFDAAFVTGMQMLHAEAFLMLVHHLPTLLICVAAFVLMAKVRRCRDDLNIKTEFKYLGCVASAAFCCIVVIDSTLSHDPALRSTARIAAFTVISAPFYFVSTKWVLDQHSLRMAENEARLARDEKEDAQLKVTLHEIFADKDYFDLFAQHLVLEFSVENLLFLLEATHFKQQCIENGLLPPSEAPKEHVDGPFIFARGINREESEVVDGISFLDNLRHIFENYIDEKGAYAINIPFGLRDDLQKGFAPYAKLFVDDANSKQRGRRSGSDHSKLAVYSVFTASKTPLVVSQFIELLSTAIEEISHLVCLDSLWRFLVSDEFLVCWRRKQNINAPNVHSAISIDLANLSFLRVLGKEGAEAAAEKDEREIKEDEARDAEDYHDAEERGSQHDDEDGKESGTDKDSTATTTVELQMAATRTSFNGGYGEGEGGRTQLSNLCFPGIIE